MKNLCVALLLSLSSMVYADVPPQVINKTCAANQYLNKIAPGPNNITCAQPTYSGILNAPSFANSVVISSNIVSLLNDASTPGNLKYYGTNGAGVKGFYDIPAPTAAPVAVTSVGAINSQTASANGGVVVGNAIYFQSAAGTTPGFLDGNAQTIAGVKTFSSAPIVSAFTNTGTVTLPTSTDTLVGRATTDTLTNKTISAASNTISNLANANLNGAAAISNINLAPMNNNRVKGNISGVAATPTDISLGTVSETTSSVLTLTNWANATIGSPSITVNQASGAQSGYLSSGDWTTFNGKQSSGNYITALTSDVAASGPGSAAATIQPNVVTNAKLAQMPANTVKGNATAGAANATDLTGADINSITGNTGDVTLGAFGSTPNSSGASLVGQVLTLQPASTSQPGGVTTGAQSFLGIKTFSNSVRLADGSNTFPALGFTNATGTGVYLSATNTLGLAAGGSLRWAIDSSNNLSGSGAATIKNATATDSIFISGGSSSSNGSNIQLYGGTNPGNPNQIFFRAGNTQTGFVSATGDWTLGTSGVASAHRMNGISINHAGGAASAFELFKDTTDGSMLLEGGTGVANSAQVRVYGSTHASQASVTQFAVGSTVNGSISSAGVFILGPTGSVASHTVNGGIGILGGMSQGGDAVTDMAAYSALFSVGTTNYLTGSSQRGMIVRPTGTAAATAEITGVYSNPTTVTGAATTAVRSAFYTANRAKGVGSTITTDIAYNGLQTTQGTNNAFLADNVGFSGNYFIHSTSVNPSRLAGDLQIGTAGKGILIKEGSNAKMGTCTLSSGGNCTVTTTAVTATSRIFLTPQNLGTIASGTAVNVSGRTAGVSFTISSANMVDTSTIAWMIVEPAP